MRAFVVTRSLDVTINHYSRVGVDNAYAFSPATPSSGAARNDGRDIDSPARVRLEAPEGGRAALWNVYVTNSPPFLHALAAYGRSGAEGGRHPAAHVLTRAAQRRVLRHPAMATLLGNTGAVGAPFVAN